MIKNIFSLFILLSCFNCVAQTGTIPTVDDLPKVIPPSPNALAIEKFTDVPVDYSTGVPSIGYPMWSWERGKLSYNVGLSYHAGGNKVDEMASNVGQGWAFNGAGRVSRTVRGRPDDLPVYGYFSHTYSIPYTSGYNDYNYYHVDIFNSPSISAAEVVTSYNSSTTYDRTKDIAGGLLDAEQDVFAISYQGLQCRFVMDKNKNVVPLQKTNLKIQPVFTGYSITAFIITDDLGLVYTFDKLESQTSIPQSDAGSIPPPQNESYVSGWLLSKVKDPNTNDSLVYNYNAVIPKSYETGFSQMQTRNFGILFMDDNVQDINQNWDAPANTFSYTQIETDEPELGSISFPDGSSLLFNYAFSRLDYYNDKALTSVIVKNYRNEQIKKYALSFSYFSCPSEPLSMSSGYNDFSKRLRLDSIKEYSADNLSKKVTAFIYNETAMNRRDSRHADHWGFHTSPARNNMEYVTTVPLEEKEMMFNPAFGTGLDGADKSPDAVYAKAGILEKIIYPTGGYVQFDYEGNRAYAEGRYYEDQLTSTVPEWLLSDFGNDHALSLANRSGTPVQFTFKTIEFDPRPVPDPNSPQLCLEESQDMQTVRFEISSTDNTFSEIVERDYYQFLGSGTKLVFELPLGKTYNIKFVYDANVSCSYIFPFKALVTAVYYRTPTDKAVGGLRLKKLVHNDGVSNVLQKEYLYTNTDGNSSAAINIIPNYGYHRVAIDWDSEIANLYTVMIPILQINRSSAPNYALDFHNGSPLVYSRVIEKQLDNSVTERYYDPIYNDYVQSSYPYVPIQQYSQLSGLLLKEVVKNNSGNILTEKEMTYSKTLTLISGNENDNYKAVKVASGLFQPYEGFATNVYRHKVAHAEETSRVEKFYDGTATLTKTTSTTYNSTQYPRSVSFTDSKGTNRKEIYTYAFEKTGTIYSNMLALNMLKYQGSTTKWKNTSDELSRKEINYNSFPTTIQASAIQSSVYANSLTDEVVFNQYDDKGNILQYTGKDGVVTSFLWGYKQQYPVAKVVGKSYAEISAAVTMSVLNLPSSDAALRTELNNLRSLSNCFVSTYSYIPLVGINSETDPNNNTTFYEYDNFNRLILIRDMNNKVLKRFCYNYYGQQDNCGGALDPNNGGDPVCTTGNCVGEDKKCINGICETGEMVVVSCVRISTNPVVWQKVYYYQWSDNSTSQQYTVTQPGGCFELE